MGTRAMVCVQMNPNGVYDLFYRHNDGNPDSLGFDLISFLVRIAHEIAIEINHETHARIVERLVFEANLRHEGRTVKEPEDAFLKVQGDLDYIYAISLSVPFNRSRFDLYKTSNPHIRKPFVFHVTGFYLIFAPQNTRDIAEKMSLSEMMSRISLSAVAGFERTQEAQP